MDHGNSVSSSGLYAKQLRRLLQGLNQYSISLSLFISLLYIMIDSRRIDQEKTQGFETDI